jgi:predicted RNA-binding Zn ribbon-like protein
MTPDGLTILEELANSLNVEKHSDQLPTPAALGRWLAAHGLAGRPTAEDHRLILQLRDDLRSTLLAHHDGDDAPGAFRSIADLAARFPLHVDLTATPPVLVADRQGPPQLVAQVIDAVMTAVRDGSWMRMRICPADDCLWAFYDDSRSGNRRWCSMGVCGNRAKLQAFRQRQAAPAITPPPS